jgi:beta-galactosidase
MNQYGRPRSRAQAGSTSNGWPRFSTEATHAVSTWCWEFPPTRFRRGCRSCPPEIAAQDQSGREVSWGRRQEINFAHPAFRWHAERVIRAVLGRYAQHPAVTGFQVDNEPGLHLLHNRDVFQGFIEFMQDSYSTVEELNRQWGLTYWSHRLTHWSELWTPDGNHSPQYQIEWRRYQTALVTGFIAWQARIVREYASPDQFVTTCICSEPPAVDDVALAGPSTSPPATRTTRCRPRYR